MALAMIEAADRFIAELRTRRPMSDDERDTQAGALIQYAAITNETAASVAALAVSLDAQRH